MKLKIQGMPDFHINRYTIKVLAASCSGLKAVSFHITVSGIGYGLFACELSVTPPTVFVRSQLQTLYISKQKHSLTSWFIKYRLYYALYSTQGDFQSFF